MNEPIAVPAEQAARRCVVLLKSVQIAHQAGYYLLNGRWHKTHQDKPVPKGVPVVAAKPESGHTRMTGEMWEKVYAHADNSNKATYVKKLDKLKEAYQAGDVHAILAGSYPNDTTNKKVVLVANYLLGLMGSDHTVTAGQKLGTHHALADVSAAPKTAEASAPVVEAPQAAQEAPVVTPEPAPVSEPVAAAEPQAAASGGLPMPDFVEGKSTTGVVDYYQAVAKEVQALHAAGDVAGLVKLKADGLEPNTKGKVGNTWKGKTANSKMLLAMQADAVQQLGGAPAPAGPDYLAKIEGASSLAAAEAFGKLYLMDQGHSPEAQEAVAAAKAKMQANLAAPAAEVPAETAKVAPNAKDSMDMAVLAASDGETATKAGFDYLQSVGSTPETVGHVVEALTVAGHEKEAASFQAAKDKAAEIKAAAAGKQPISTMVANAGSASAAKTAAVTYVIKNKQTTQAYDEAIAALHEHGYSAVADLLVEAKNEAHPPADGPKEGDTKQGADGMLVLKNGHWVKADQGAAEAPAETHPVDLIPMPDLSDLNYPEKAKAGLEALKAQVKEQGASALKGLTKKMKVSGKLITKLPHLGSAYKITGYEHLGHKSHAQIYHYVESLKAAAGKPAAKPKAAAAAAPATAPAPVSSIPSMDSWQQIGPQAGSNAGGKFVDPDGGVWYCKFPKDEDIAKSEVLAAKLYAAAGIAGQDAQLVTKDGKVGIASKWVDVSKASPADLAKAKGTKAGFAVDAWLANHDVIGLEFDNLQIDANGNAVRVDAGGSLEYRAQGAKKEFGDSVTEIETLRDKAVNSKSAAVFGKMTKADITASVANVLKVSSAQIYALVNTYGPGTPEEKAKLAATLVARKADLLAKYPKAKKEKKIIFKPEDISAPPSFVNWGGSGASGPSSKEFINQANEKAVQSIYVAAQTGDPEKVKGLSAETYNKATGEVTGIAPVLDHPSQHVKGYAQQALNEIHQQLNPPKVFRFDGGHPLHSLNDAYPALNSAKHGETVEKAGKFLVLGSPGVIDLAALGLTPSTWANGKLTQATYSPAAHAIVKAMPVTQKQAIVSYTGAGYGAMNSSLWSGNPTGASKSAAEALNTLGHEIVPGTILSRKLSLSGSGLDQILASTGKILQEPAIMSTSIRPSSWSGNTQLKLHVGPGVKGLWVGKGSTGGNSGLSQHQGEDEMILPPNTRILVLSVKKVSGADADGFGNGINHVIEAVILPSEQPAK